MPKALIIGGGIAGHASALFLRTLGWSVVVAEATARPQPYEGLFLNVATNGLAVLDLLGLKDEVLANAHAAPLMVMKSSTGSELGSVPNGPALDPDRGGAIIRRGTLQQILNSASVEAGVCLGYGKRLNSYTERASDIVAHFEDGTSMSADLLIGSDGIGSSVRAQIDPKAPQPEFTGLVGLGGYAAVPDVEPTTGAQYMVFGAKAFFGYLVREGHTAYWFANLTSNEPDREALALVESGTWIDRLAVLHEGDPEPVGTIIKNTTGKVGAYPIYQLNGVQRWSRGRAVLVGDAAHATSPSAGQGASLALEDAATLARCLDACTDFNQAFSAYQRERQPRAELVAKYARAVDKQKRVTKSRFGIAMRDAMMPFFLRRVSKSTRNDYLYNYDVGWDQSRLHST